MQLLQNQKAEGFSVQEFLELLFIQLHENTELFNGLPRVEPEREHEFWRQISQLVPTEKDAFRSFVVAVFSHFLGMRARCTPEPDAKLENDVMALKQVMRLIGEDLERNTAHPGLVFQDVFSFSRNELEQLHAKLKSGVQFYDRVYRGFAYPEKQTGPQQDIAQIQSMTALFRLFEEGLNGRKVKGRALSRNLFLKNQDSVKELKITAPRLIANGTFVFGHGTSINDVKVRDRVMTYLGEPLNQLFYEAPLIRTQDTVTVEKYFDQIACKASF